MATLDDLRNIYTNEHWQQKKEYSNKARCILKIGKQYF